MKPIRSFSVVGLILAMAVLSSCKKDEDKPQNNTTTTFDLKPVLENSASIITGTYDALHIKAELLEAAVNKLKDDPTQVNLEAARNAWRAARVEWEQSEGFLFGPVDSKGIDPSIDSWPLNKIDLDAVLNSSAVLTPEYIESLEGTQKGFHTIEYLLFGENADKKITDFTPRQFEYLLATTESLEEACDVLLDTWLPSKENFAANLTEAGTNKSIYPSQKAALQDLVNGLITIADEVGNGKIQDPYAAKDVNLEESQFSDNSKTDFQDNMRSIQNIYTGKYRTISGKSISDWVASSNTDLDAKIKKQTQEAIDAIGAIPGTFTDAIFNNGKAVENAQEKVRALQQTLESELLPLVDKVK